jgi:hypothetical protein
MSIRNHLRFLVALILTASFPFALGLLAIVLLPELAPAPKLSADTSFNEKARWFRMHSSGYCDILVIGSSIALNNVSGSELGHHAAVFNLGSWGMNLDDDLRILQIVEQACHPKVVIMPVSFADFTDDYDKHVDWDLTSDYLLRSQIATYLRSFDLVYYLNEFLKLRNIHSMGRSTYLSLDFDDSGTVPLACEGFHIDPHRWSGFTSRNSIELSDEKRRKLQKLGEHFKNKDFILIVASTPIRKAAIDYLKPLELDHFWSELEDAVNASGAAFIRADNGAFPDELFVDYLHLCKRGAVAWTRELMSKTSNLTAYQR